MLKVLDAEKEDELKAIARVSPSIMERLSLKDGDVIEIKGEVAAAARAFQSNDNTETIKLDKTTQKNARAPKGKQVTVKKIQPGDAEEITAVVIENKSNVELDAESVVNTLVTYPVTVDDEIPLPFKITIKVLAHKPETSCVVITKHTRVLLSDLLPQKPAGQKKGHNLLNLLRRPETSNILNSFLSSTVGMDPLLRSIIQSVVSVSTRITSQPATTRSTGTVQPFGRYGKSVNCPGCGATLQILDPKEQSVTCAFCGAKLAGSSAMTSPAVQSADASKTKCPACATKNPQDSAFCNQCGSRLRNICKKCNHQNTPSSKFCNSCGCAL
ncbi:double zinc ribbon domain-containing protein [Nitrososphaera sp.]|uniref:double zinc ribbon domain-containing protein n=1 Tax=Nitrososphaera sp. TaxID=1971748 RepID=UPI002ED82222